MVSRWNPGTRQSGHSTALQPLVDQEGDGPPSPTVRHGLQKWLQADGMKRIFLLPLLHYRFVTTIHTAVVTYQVIATWYMIPTSRISINLLAHNSSAVQVQGTQRTCSNPLPKIVAEAVHSGVSLLL